MDNSIREKRKFDYAWIMIGLCFMMILTSLGFCSSGRTLYLTAITGALGIPRGAFALNDTFRYVTTTIINMYFGKLVYRFGMKKLICAGFLCLIAFALLNTVATTVYTFYFASILLGLGLSWTGTTMVSSIVHRWCTSNKGTITGAVLAANGVGGAIAVQILSPIIFQEGNPFGYRTSYMVVSCVLLVALALVLILFREKPKGQENVSGEIPKKQKKARGAGWIGMDYSEALKKPYLYVALLCMFFTGMALQGLGGIAVPHMYDVGISIEFVAMLTSFTSVLLTVSKFATGFLYDRLGMRISMNIGFVCSFISLLGLVFLANTPEGRVLAVVRGVAGVVALPLETVMLPLFASELFGNKNFDKFVGLFVSASCAGFAIGSPFANFCFDFFGGYQIAFLIFGAMMLFVTVAMQFVLSAAHRDRKKILAEVAGNREITL
ncbi:MAG: OFA family MFS transporter [Ruminococcaceae bacterium]|nr:OFA family MFS transporter [Oscillospiraceae bacterium]